MSDIEKPKRRKERRARPAGPGPLRLEWRESGLYIPGVDGGSVPVRARRCFPWSEVGRWISLRDDEEQELALIENAGDLDRASRRALERALDEAVFMLVVESVEDVDEEFELRTWKVTTRQGPRSFQTRLDDWPRQTPGGGLLIRDLSGDLYHVPDVEVLDGRSREFLWAFTG
jgi:hypothetical protein